MSDYKQQQLLHSLESLYETLISFQSGLDVYVYALMSWFISENWSMVGKCAAALLIAYLSLEE